MKILNTQTAQITFTSLYQVSKNGITGRYYNVQFANGDSISTVFATSRDEAITEAKQMLINFMESTCLEKRIASTAHRTNAYKIRSQYSNNSK